MSDTFSAEDIHNLIQAFNVAYAPLAVIDKRLSAIAKESVALAKELDHLKMERHELVKKMTHDSMKIFAVIAKQTKMPLVPLHPSFDDMGNMDYVDIDRVAKILKSMETHGTNT